MPYIVLFCWVVSEDATHRVCLAGALFTALECLQAQSRKQAKEDREVANQRHVRQVGELEARLKEMQDTEALLQEEMERCQSQYRDQLQETQVSFGLSETHQEHVHT